MGLQKSFAESCGYTARTGRYWLEGTLPSDLATVEALLFGKEALCRVATRA